MAVAGREEGKKVTPIKMTPTATREKGIKTFFASQGLALRGRI
jgi:hypothetical protein